MKKKQIEQIKKEYTTPHVLKENGQCKVCKAKVATKIKPIITHQKDPYFELNPENQIPVCDSCFKTFDKQKSSLLTHWQEEFFQHRTLKTLNEVLSFFDLPHELP